MKLYVVISESNTHSSHEWDIELITPIEDYAKSFVGCQVKDFVAIIDRGEHPDFISYRIYENDNIPDKYNTNKGVVIEGIAGYYEKWSIEIFDI